MLANRLKLIFRRIVSTEQNGFIPGHKIIDCILLINEVVHTLKTSRKVGMIIKFDVCKRYDKVCWGFLLKAMEKLGFDSY